MQPCKCTLTSTHGANDHAAAGARTALTAKSFQLSISEHLLTTLVLPLGVSGHRRALSFITCRAASQLQAAARSQQCSDLWASQLPGPRCDLATASRSAAAAAGHSPAVLLLMGSQGPAVCCTGIKKKKKKPRAKPEAASYRGQVREAHQVCSRYALRPRVLGS